MKYVGVSVAFVLIAACAAGQQNAASSTGAASEQVAKNKAQGKRVCRHVESTGSIMRTSVCKTQEQWTVEDKAAQDEVARIRNSQRSGSEVQ